MTPTFKPEITLGTVLQAIILLLGMAAAYGAFSARFDSLATTVNGTQKDVHQIQHYLSDSDPQYWKKVAANGDANQ